MPNVGRNKKKLKLDKPWTILNEAESLIIFALLSQNRTGPLIQKATHIDDDLVVNVQAYVQSVKLSALSSSNFPLKVDSLSTVADISDSLEVFDEDTKKVPTGSKSVDASVVFRIQLVLSLLLLIPKTSNVSVRLIFCLSNLVSCVNLP